MYNRTYNNDNKYKAHKLSVGKASLKLKIQQSKRNNSKIKNKKNNLSINNDYMNNSKIKSMHYNNSVLNNNKKINKEYIKENKIPKSINNRSKVLSITSNPNDVIYYNNFLTNNNSISKKNNDLNSSNNENINNSYIHITLNSNNPYNNQNITNISSIEKDTSREKDKKEKKIYDKKLSSKPISFDVKYNITVNKIFQNNNNININDNINNSTIKERVSMKEKNRVIRKNKRDLSVKHRNENYNSNKRINIKEKYNSNNSNKRKNYSPLLEQKDSKYISKISCPINSNINTNINSNMQYNSHNMQKSKNIFSTVNTTNTVSYSNNNNSNYNTYNINLTTHINTNQNEEEYFENSNDKIQELTKEEKLIYGDRIMKGYIKQKLLGKGGCGVVWLCTKTTSSQIFYESKSSRKFNNIINNYKDIITNEEYAVKQTTKKNGTALMNFADENVLTAKNEIKILCKLNNEDYNDFIPRIYDYYEDNNDIWFSFEKGGKSISGLSFKIKGEFEKGERIYFIQKGKFLINLFSTISQFKYLLKSLLLGIDYINKRGIIHSDIKPENILIEYKGDSNENNFEITSIKIIDYGSAFYVNNTSSISSNTPEYLCPEITIPNKKFIKELKNNNLKYVNCIDIWSLGITILELCLCCPIWMNYKAKIIINGKTYHSNGLFGCRGRDANKIYQKQVELSKNFKKKLKNSMLYLFEQNDRENFMDLLKKMLEMDYKKRITCEEAINHPFFSN